MTDSNRGTSAFDRGLAHVKPQPVLRWPDERTWPFEVYYSEFLRVKAHLVKRLAIGKA